MRSRISDKTQWAEALAQKLSRGMRTNFYGAAEEFFPLIAEGRLYREEFPGGCYYFAERAGQVDCYFFLEKDAAPAAFSAWEKPVLLEQVATVRRGISPTAEEWAAIGFQPYLQRKRLFRSAKNLEIAPRTVTFAEEGEAEQILRLMQAAFEPYTSALPTKETLLADLREKRVIAARQNGALIGFLRFGRERQVSVLWQIAVVPEGRSKGIGDALVQDWLFLERDAAKFQLWVREDNPMAIKMYENRGFLADGRIAPVQIKQKNKSENQERKMGMDTLLKILAELRPDVDFEGNQELVDSGELDSFDIVSLVGELCEEYDIEIGADDIVPENFNSAEAIWALVQKLQED